MTSISWFHTSIFPVLLVTEPRHSFRELCPKGLVDQNKFHAYIVSQTAVTLGSVKRTKRRRFV